MIVRTIFKCKLFAQLVFFQRLSASFAPLPAFLDSKVCKIEKASLCKMGDKPYHQMTDDDWEAKGLSKEAIKVTRHAGTERPNSSPLYKHSETGLYHCVCCGTPLFKSDHKFNSGCGWPAFYADSFEAMVEREDISHGMRRIEVLCKTCGAHLGHKFDDAKYHNKMVPVDTRYCINGVSLEFRKA